MSRQPYSRDQLSDTQYQALPPRQSSTVPLHVTSPSGNTSQEYEYKAYGPTHRSAQAPQMPSHHPPQNAFSPPQSPLITPPPLSSHFLPESAPQAVGPITRVCPKCRHQGPPIMVSDTSWATCCCNTLCVCLACLLAILGSDDDNDDNSASNVPACANCKTIF